MASSRRFQPLPLAVLSSLAEKPQHPYGIFRLLRARGADRAIKITYGSLYSLISWLEQRGLIESVGTTREGSRPERTIYRLTQPGADELVSREAELVRYPQPEYPKFGAALVFASNLQPDDLLDQLEIRLGALGDRLSELTSASTTAPRILRLEREYEYALISAEIDFVKQLVLDIRNDRVSGLGS